MVVKFLLVLTKYVLISYAVVCCSTIQFFNFHQFFMLVAYIVVIVIKTIYAPLLLHHCKLTFITCVAFNIEYRCVRRASIYIGEQDGNNKSVSVIRLVSTNTLIHILIHVHNCIARVHGSNTIFHTECCGGSIYTLDSIQIIKMIISLASWPVPTWTPLQSRHNAINASSPIVSSLPTKTDVRSTVWTTLCECIELLVVRRGKLEKWGCTRSLWRAEPIQRMHNTHAKSDGLQLVRNKEAATKICNVAAPIKTPYLITIKYSKGLLLYKIL